MTFAIFLAKVTVALALGLLAVWIARGSRAALRHTILAATFGVLLLLPVSLIPMRRVEIPVKSSPHATLAPSPARAAYNFDARPSAALHATLSAAPATVLPSPSTLLFAAWLAGFLFTSAPLFLAIRHSRMLRRDALPWPLDRSPAGPTAIGIHEALPGPVVCGILRPMILLPPDSQHWSAEDLNRAILHELEHVRRRDRIWHIASRALCAVYWFHPLIWMAWRRLVLEAEKSCDDAVLSRSDNVAYADQLVALARRMSSAPISPVLAMAARADLSARIDSLLDIRQPRGRAGARFVTLAAASAALLAFSMTAFRLVAAPQETATRTVPGPTPELDAVSVKLIDPASEGQHWHEHSDSRHFNVTGSMHGFILRFYGIRGNQLLNEPGWFTSRLYNIEAATSAPVRPDGPVYLGLLRDVLTDRFHLRLGDSTRDLPVYFLERASRGPKFRELKDNEAVPRFPRPPQGVFGRTFTSIEDLLNQFNGRFGGPAYVDRPVIDHTGLNKRYVMRLETESMGADASGERQNFPNLLSDLQSQLGLRLVAGRAPLHVFTVDHVEAPSPN
ncbi:MAG TPA: M56 family metallopeptidase [Bryobacteraceae bacterium]|nr:M56 family metallopeptidase [Bryobacteraceae bacterium]